MIFCFCESGAKGVLKFFLYPTKPKVTWESQNKHQNASACPPEEGEGPALGTSP